MTKLLLDESVPKNLTTAFPAKFEIHTVQQAGWAGTKNGELLKLAKENEFAAFITADGGIAHQQNLDSLDIVVVVLKAYRTHIDYLAPLVPEIVTFLEEKPGNGVHVFGE